MERAANRFAPRFSGFLPFLIDKNGAESRRNVESVAVLDEPKAPVPCWRSPQPFPHWHEDHEVNLVVEGTALYHWWPGQKCDGDPETVTVSSGQMLLVPAGVMHTIVVSGHARVCGLWMHCELYPPLLRALPADGVRLARRELVRQLCQWETPLRPRLLGDATLFARLLEIFYHAQSELGRQSPWRDEMLVLLGRQSALLFLRALETRPVADNAPSQERVSAVQAWMERHYLERPSLESLASRAGMSASHFSNVFRARTGQSPGAFLLAIRLRHAAELLVTSDLPIVQIANMTGFAHAATFNHAFKARFGQSPGDYRQVMRAEL